MFVRGVLNKSTSKKNLNVWLNQSKYIEMTNEVQIFKYVYLCTNGTDAQLVKLKNDGTDSYITIHGSIASYLSSFRIYRVIPVTANMFIIEYDWMTSDVVYSIPYMRVIMIKSDGSLTQSGENSVGSATNATTICYHKLSRSLLANNLEKRYKNVTRSNNNTALYLQDSAFAMQSGTVSWQDSVVSVTSAANVYAPPYDKCVSRGGMFYNNGKNNYFAYELGYYEGYLARPLTEQDSIIQALGSVDHYVVDLDSNGFLVTVKIVNGYANVYIFYLDMTLGSGQTLQLLNYSYNIGFTLGDNNIIGFKNDTFILSNGQRFKLTTTRNSRGFRIDEIDSLDISHMYDNPYTYEYRMFSPDSDFWEGVLIY